MFPPSLLLLAWLAAPAAALAQAADDDLAPLAGKWQAVEGTRNGVRLTRDDLAPYQLTLGVDALKRQAGGRTGWRDPFAGGGTFFDQHALHCDLTTTPPKIYIIRPSGLKAISHPGIFKLDGDRLIVCWNLEPWLSTSGPAARPTPKDFTAPKASGQTLLVFERAK